MDIKIIDLSQQNKQPIMLEETRFISIGRQRCKSTGGIFGPVKKWLNKHQHIDKKVTLSVEDLNIDKNLVIKDSKNLFTIFYDTEKKEQREFPLEITMHRLKEPFFLLFNVKEIEDCIKSQNGHEQNFRIDYSLALRDEKGELIEKNNETLLIQFKDETNVPQIRIFLNNPNIQYQSNVGLQKIGDLKIQLPNSLKYAPSVDLKIDLQVEDSFGNPINDFIIVKKGNEVCKIISETKLRTKTQANGKVTAVIGYELYVDLDKVANPMKDVEIYTIIGNAKYKYSYNDTYLPFRDLNETFEILKDTQGTELVVSVYRDNTSLQKQQNSWSIPQIDFTANQLVYPVRFTIDNKASDTSRPNAGLTIKNLKVHSILNEGVVLYNNKQEDVAINRIIEIRGHELDITTHTGIFIANGDTGTSFNVNFSPALIYSIRREGSKVFNFNVTTKIEFDYIEDRMGDGNAEIQHFAGNLEWTLFKKANPEWLSVDFGSSAIVCYYGKGAQSDLINLRLARQKVYEAARKSTENPNGFEPNEVKDMIERDTPFLSSDILFNDVTNSSSTSLCSQISYDDNVKYNTIAVLLSPTEKLSANNFRRQLPCLKVLMGNQFLPENDHYKAFRYNYIDGGNVVSNTAGNLRDQQHSLLNIENIFKETYYTLFHYFIQDGTILEQANKVVLTYPNTYTPHNLVTMRNIVKQTLPSVREVQFVSESDAVATYYMSHWVEYHSPEDDIQKDESILVYDMGAGTLDVTLLTKHYEQEQNKFILTINGKIGTGRAGNYLDYVIAQILYKKLKSSNFKKSWISTDMRAVENEILEARVLLKSIIKTKIKPALSGTEKIKFTIEKKDFTINPSDILDDELFIDFLDSVSTKIWKNMKKYVGTKEFNVDTIILSGRSLRLNKLQERISEFARKNKAVCIMLDNIISGPNAGKTSDRSKTAVVEGAKTYVETYMTADTPVLIRSRRLQASYGVAFKRTGGRWDYHEILSRRDIPFNDENRREFSRPNGPLVIEHTNESDVIKLIQTYLSEEDTKRALNSNNEEFISIMSEVMMSDFDNKASLNLDVMVDRNNNVSLYADGNETQYKAPAGVDLADEITLRSLWPVSIVNE